MARTSQTTDGEKKAARIVEKFWECSEKMQKDESEDIEGISRQTSEAEVQVQRTWTDGKAN